MSPIQRFRVVYRSFRALGHSRREALGAAWGNVRGSSVPLVKSRAERMADEDRMTRYGRP